MLGLEITKEIFTSFAGTTLALLSAGLVWILKSAFDKHRAEVMALAKYERCFSANFEVLNDNFDFLNQWIDSIKNNNRSFSAHFEHYLIDDNEHYKIGDLELINQIVYINYELRRTEADFDHLQNGYLKTLSDVDSIPNEEGRIRNLNLFHQNFVTGLERMIKNRDHLKREIFKIVARIRLVSNVRKYSLFYGLTFLFKDVWPRATESRFNKELEQIHKEVVEKEKINSMSGKDLQK